MRENRNYNFLPALPRLSVILTVKSYREPCPSLELERFKEEVTVKVPLRLSAQQFFPLPGQRKTKRVASKHLFNGCWEELQS